MSSWNKTAATGERCVIELPLSYSRHQHDTLDKMFRIANNMKNNLIAWYSRQLTEMMRTRIWRSNQKALADLYSEYVDEVETLEKLQEKISRKKKNAGKKKAVRLFGKDEQQLAYLQSRVDEFTEKKKALCVLRNEIIRRYGFSKADFEKQMKKYRKSYQTLIGSTVAQKIADSVWAMFDAKLYRNGKDISFSPFAQFAAIEGKSNKTNIVFDKEKMAVTLGGGSNKLRIRVKRSRKDPYGYEKDALSRRVCYCRIIRKAYPEGWRYFLQLVLEGPPPVKIKPETGELLHIMGKGCVGLDIGPQTLAFSANKDVGLEELAEGVQLAQDEIRRIKRSMDRSRKNSNPKMFTADGQIVRKSKLPAECLNSRGRRIWVKTSHYKKMEVLLRSLYRKQAALRKHLHRRMANQLLSMGDEFYVEDMRWKALAKRAKETRRNKKGKILSKKRYGKSIANKAPAMFLAILEQKVIASGGSFQRIVTWKAKASQFSHETGKCNKKKLSQRWHYLEDGTKVQRDLYSAFLIQHTNKNLESFNLRTCEKDFPIFLKMHQEEIERLQSLDKRMPSSMGIKKTA